MLALSIAFDQFTGSINQTFTGVGQANAVDITNSAATFSLPRPVRTLIWSQVFFANNAGFTDYAYIYLDVDGARTGFGLAVGTAFEAVTETLMTCPQLAQGNHTVKLRAYVGAAGNTGICYSAEIFAFYVGL